MFIPVTGAVGPSHAVMESSAMCNVQPMGDIVSGGSRDRKQGSGL